MTTEELVREVAQAVEHEGNARAVFGAPVKLDSKTVIPVAAVRFGGGGGGMHPDAGNSTLAKALFSGGAGGAFDVHPVGFIHERDGQVLYTPIHLDVRNKPFLNEAASGLGRLVETLSGVGQALFRKKGASAVH
ncbi:MAG: hypothetical protein IPJ65_40100 [Archangiaceae bacterium]|nr:hypothetical protein [Archangiaceae bacterium]